jgi:RimJ/RimL family protein N-acetyltransferase
MENRKLKIENPSPHLTAILSDNIILRPLESRDLQSRVEWFNDPQVRATLVVTEQFELEKTQRWFDRLQSDPTRVEFAVEDLAGVCIGVTGLVGIEKEHGLAECYCVIGNKAYWGKKLGTEIHSVLFQWAFETLDIVKIRADIRTNNPAIFRVVEKLGFKIEGTLRQEKVVDGHRIDLYRIGLLREEFTPAHKRFEITTTNP